MIDEYWYGFIRKVLYESPACYLSSTGRRYVSDVGFVVPGEDWAKGISVTLHDLGYQGRSTKMSQLMRNYYNAEAVQLGREKLMGRADDDMDFTSVSISMQNQGKDKRSQGHCMISMVVTHIPKSTDGKPRTTVTMFYRTTEVIRKFGADLIFLSQEVIPAVLPDSLYPIHEVRFQLANAFFSPLFVPVLYRFIDPVDLLRGIEDNAPNDGKKVKSILKSCMRAIRLPLVETDPNHYNFRARKNMHNLALDNMKYVNKERLVEYLKERGEL